MRVCFNIITKNKSRVRHFAEFIQTQKSYPTSLGKVSVPAWILLLSNQKYFLWTKLIENLLHAKYCISVPAGLTIPNRFLSFERICCVERFWLNHIDCLKRDLRFLFFIVREQKCIWPNWISVMEICFRRDFIWQDSRTSIHLFEALWNDDLVSYFSVMHCCEIDTNLLLLSISRAEMQLCLFKY